MKRCFNEPKMMVSTFSAGDVITVSGNSLGDAAVSKLRNSSNSKLSLDGKSTISSDLIYLNFDMGA